MAMYDLKTQFDVQRLVGETLELVCFAKFQFELFFSHSIGIRIEVQNLEESPSNQALMLIAALQHSVIEACVILENDFTLTFDNGSTLLVHAEDNYEGYHITADGKTVTI
jgi:hypothetical protein